MTTRVGLVQLGCAKNQVDGEEMLGALAGAGDVIFVADKRDADVLVVNTCGFIQSAKEESIRAILDAVELKNRGGVSRVIVTGCLSQRYGEELARDIPEVDAFLGIESAPRVGNVVFGAAPHRRNLVEGVAEKYPLVPPARLRASATPWTAYLKVSEGCDHTCTFCAIPGIRGKHRSKPMERLVREATELAAGGAVELNLVAQDTTAYGMDLYGRLALPELLERLSVVPGVAWIRLLYCYPTMVRQPLIDAVAGLPNVIPYIDMPLQHGDDDMLARMKRGGSVDQYKRLFDRMRAAIPGMVLRTTFLVGFPGETDAQFENLLQFVRDVRFDRVGVFTYSAEENTPSFSLPGAVPAGVMRRRRDAVMALQQEISRQRNLEWLGRKIDVLIEERAGGCLTGRSYRDAPEIDGTVEIAWDPSLPPPSLGSMVRARVVSAQDYDLGAVVDSLPA
ncbi:MAG: 30S ribosomal protein S12 methylthiotransferase RimO [Capsulimonadaceae bacterium]